MTHYVTINFNDSGYATFKTTKFRSVEDLIRAIVEDKVVFLYELLGGDRVIDDSDELDSLEITGIF